MMRIYTKHTHRYHVNTCEKWEMCPSSSSVSSPTVPVVTDGNLLTHWSVTDVIQIGFDKLWEQILQIICVWNEEQTVFSWTRVDQHTRCWEHQKLYLHTVPPAVKRARWTSERYDPEVLRESLDRSIHLQHSQSENNNTNIRIWPDVNTIIQ